MSMMQTRDKRKRVTIEQLASRLRLSPATVSFVLNGKEKEHRIAGATAARVRKEAARLDYHPSPIARQLVGMRSNAVGVLINTQATADPRLIQNMEIIAAERGIRFIVGHAVGTQEQVKAYLADFRDRGVDGIISVFHSHPDYAETVLPELARFDNVVYFERPEEEPSGTSTGPCYVQPDYYEVGRLGVQHLLDGGRRKIALVMNDQVFPYARARHRAYDDTMAAAGWVVQSGLLWVMDQQPGKHWSDRFDGQLALQAVDHVVIDGGADAIVVVNDLYAARLIAALRRRGRRVPDDVAVVGCDDLDIGTLIDPQITTIDLHATELASAVVSMLFELLDHGTVAEERRATVLQPTLIVRESS
jgi:DNA-binding LacI/PurR family transcriptional regulator